MSTVINTAVTAMVDALKRAPAVVANVDRVRLRPVAQGVSQAIAVRPVQSEAMQVQITPAGMPVSWETTITVECYAKSNATTAPDVALDALLQAAYTRLMEDPTLGGACYALATKGVQFDFDADGDQTACASIVFIAKQRANGATLT